MLIEEIYHKSVLAIDEDKTVREAVGIMLKHNFNGLIVTNKNDKVVGVFSLQDVAGATLPRQFKENVYMANAMYTPGFFKEMVQKIENKKVKKIMRRDFMSVSRDTQIMAVTADFLKNDLYIVPVMDGDKLVGLVTRSEIKHALAKAMELEITKSRD